MTRGAYPTPQGPGSHAWREMLAAYGDRRADFQIGRLARATPELNAADAEAVSGPHKARRLPTERLPTERLGHRVAFAASWLALGAALAVVFFGAGA